MTKEDIMRLAEASGVEDSLLYEHWRCNLESMTRFAALVASAERERIYAEQLQLPEPRLTGKFFITAGKFKCTGCTGTWVDREDAKHHSCKDYQ